MPNARLVYDKHQFCKSLIWFCRGSNHNSPKWTHLLIRLSCLVRQTDARETSPIDWLVVSLRHVSSIGHIHGDNCFNFLTFCSTSAFTLNVKVYNQFVSIEKQLRMKLTSACGFVWVPVSAIPWNWAQHIWFHFMIVIIYSFFFGSNKPK